MSGTTAVETAAPAAVAAAPVAETTDLSNSNVVSKYREASTVAQSVLEGILTVLLPGKRAGELCAIGDAMILSLVAPLYKNNKKLEKGVAFPTCISVNSIVAHYSPMDSEDKVVLAAGDIVKM